MTHMTDELRKRANALAYGYLIVGDDRVPVGIRAGMIQSDNTFVRSLGGSPIGPGTNLFVTPDNAPYSETVNDLLRVISAQAGDIERLRKAAEQLQAGMQAAYEEGAADRAVEGNDFDYAAGWRTSDAYWRNRGVTPVLTPVLGSDLF